jgi:hypothetical protein
MQQRPLPDTGRTLVECSRLRFPARLSPSLKDCHKAPGLDAVQSIATHEKVSHSAELLAGQSLSSGIALVEPYGIAYHRAFGFVQDSNLFQNIERKQDIM